MKKNTEILEQVIHECWNNSSFMDKLKSDPVNSIEELTGHKIELPIGAENILIVDQTDPDKIYVNIPIEPKLENMELTENEMDDISAGSAVNLRCMQFKIIERGPVICKLPGKVDGIPNGGIKGVRTTSTGN